VEQSARGDFRAADLQEEPTKRVENAGDSANDRFVGSDEDGGSSANIAASGASHQKEQSERSERSNQT
jgi:hypothetical protein